MGQDQITIRLGILNVKVFGTAVNESGEIIITTETTRVGARCRQCGKWITKAQGQEE